MTYIIYYISAHDDYAMEYHTTPLTEDQLVPMLSYILKSQRIINRMVAA